MLISTMKVKCLKDPPPPEKKVTSKYISPFIALNSRFVEIL
jgi:hypothetical protein